MGRGVNRPKRRPRFCLCCLERYNRWGWCDRCKALREAIDAALAEPPEPTEAEDAQRRLDRLRSRAKTVKFDKRYRNKPYED